MKKFLKNIENNALVPVKYTNLIKQKSEELVNLIKYRYEGAKIRTRVKYTENKEQHTKNFIKKEIIHASKKQITKLKNYSMKSNKKSTASWWNAGAGQLLSEKRGDKGCFSAQNMLSQINHFNKRA